MNSLEVGQHAAQPAVIHIRHTNALGFFLNCFLSLLLGANEENIATMCNSLLNEVVGLVNVSKSLLEINDVNTVAFSEDETLHLRIPTAGLMTKVCTCIKQLLHSYNSHVVVET